MLEKLEEQKIIVEQYKAYLNTIISVSERRVKTSQFYITLNTALFAFISVVIAEKHSIFLIIITSAVGFLNSYLWYRAMKSYKAMNFEKYKNLKKIEERLPIQPVNEEWKSVSKIINMNDKKNFQPSAYVEVITPFLFMFLYFILLFSFFIF